MYLQLKTMPTSHTLVEVMYEEYFTNKIALKITTYWKRRHSLPEKETLTFNKNTTTYYLDNTWHIHISKIEEARQKYPRLWASFIEGLSTECVDVQNMSLNKKKMLKLTNIVEETMELLVTSVNEDGSEYKTFS